MKNQRKTFWSGLLAIFLGASCCWLSSLAIWAGGAGLLGVIANYTESIQIPLIIIGVILLSITSFRYYKSKKS